MIIVVDKLLNPFNKDDVPLSDLKSTPTVSSTTPAPADSKNKKALSAAKDTPSGGRSTPKSSTAAGAKDTPERTTTGEKRKAAESTPTTTTTGAATPVESGRKAQKKSAGDDVKTRKGSSRVREKFDYLFTYCILLKQIST